MKILIVNAYSARNLGDAGIVVAMIHLLRAEFPHCKIAVMSSYWRENRTFYESYGVESVPSVWELKTGQGAMRRYLSGIKCFLEAMLFPDSRKFAEYLSADLVLSAGGGYLYSSRKGRFGIGLLNALFHYWLGTRLGKPVIGFPQSLGPFHSTLDTFLAKAALRRTSLLISRDPISTAMLNQFGGVRFVEIPDVAFTLDTAVIPNPNPNATAAREARSVGITVLDWKFAKAGTSESEITDYLHRVAAVVKCLWDRDSHLLIRIFPQVDVGGQDSDVPISLRLAALLDDPRCTVVRLPEEIRPEQLVELYAGVDLFIASRMHSAIFALAGGVPTLALAYQPKTTGTFSLLEMEDRVFPIDSFDVFEVVSCAESLLGVPREDPSNLASRVRRELLNSLAPFVPDVPQRQS